MSRLLAYAPEHVAVVTGIPTGTLRSWERDGIFLPHTTFVGGRSQQWSVYSFEDLIDLCALWWVRHLLDAPEQTLRAVTLALQEDDARRWSRMHVYAAGLMIEFTAANGDRNSKTIDVPLSGSAETLERETVERDIERRSVKLQERRPDQIGRIEPLAGEPGRRPVLAGTRIPTIAIWEFHEAGYSAMEIVDQYPRLTTADVESAIAYEADLRTSRKVS